MTCINNANRDEINLRDLWCILFRAKWWIAIATAAFAVAGVLYSLSLPNMYRSEGIYAPAQQTGAGGGLAAQYGGLAAIAGINLNGGRNIDVDQAMALIMSWPFLEELVEKKHLAPLVLAVEGWDQQSQEIVWNTQKYDVQTDRWLGSEKGEKPPTSFEVYKELSQFIECSIDSKTGMVSIAVTHYSPEIAADWVKLFVAAINTHFQARDISEAKSNIDYLQSKISETGIAQMQAVFYGMIETQLKTLMLAEVSDEYLLKEVVAPKVAEIKSKPKRSLICALFVILGAGISSFVALVIGVARLSNVDHLSEKSLGVK